MIAFGCSEKPSDNGNPQVVSVDLPTGGFTVGGQEAQAELVEFGSYSCPYCKTFWETTLRSLQRTHIEPGTLRFRYVEISNRPEMVRIAAWVECARESLGDDAAVQKAFEMANDSAAYMRIAGLAGETPCVAQAETRIAVEQEGARRLGISRIPTFVVGKASDTGVIGWVLEDVDPDLILRTTADAVLAVK